MATEKKYGRGEHPNSRRNILVGGIKTRFKKGIIQKKRRHSKETKLKISDNSKKMWKNSEIRKKLLESHRKGIYENDDTKRRIANSISKLWKNKDWRENQVKKRLGKPTWNKGLTKEIDKRVKLGSEKQIKYYKEHPEAIEKIKTRRSKQIFPVIDTTIEVKIQDFLKQLGIEYFTHQYMKIEHGYQCDILIPSMNLVIECDGDYWHKYPTGKEIDHIRTKELLEKGFKVLRLWEHEIRKMKINKFKERINVC